MCRQSFSGAIPHLRCPPCDYDLCPKCGPPSPDVIFPPPMVALNVTHHPTDQWVGATLVRSGSSAEGLGPRIRYVMECQIGQVYPSFRVIPPGGMVTMDYSPHRLNINIDHANTITGVHYG